MRLRTSIAVADIPVVRSVLGIADTHVATAVLLLWKLLRLLLLLLLLSNDYPLLLRLRRRMLLLLQLFQACLE